MAKIKIAEQPPAMDSERVLDLLGKQFEGEYVAGAAEWLKNALDHAIRLGEVGEPVIVFHIMTPRARRTEWMMECIDFLGTSYEEIDQHLKVWGSEIAASRGTANWAGFGGHGNGGKFHMRENFARAEFVTYRDGRITVFGFNEKKRYGFDDRYKGAEVAPDKALAIAGIDAAQLPIPDEVKADLLSDDPARCHFTVVRGVGFRHAQRWRMRESFDDKLRAHPQAKQVLSRARVIYKSDIEMKDPLLPPVIPSREGFEDGRDYDMPGELPYDGAVFRISSEAVAGTLQLNVAADPFTRIDLSHAIDIRGRNGLVIASYRVRELPIRNRVGAEFIYGALDCPALDELGLRSNARDKLVPNDITDAVLEWVCDRVDELSDELAKAENREREKRDVDATLLLSSRLNKWKNKFLRAREIMIAVGSGEGAGEGGTGGGGTGGTGTHHEGDGQGDGGTGTGGQGQGGSGAGTGGGGSGDEQKRAPRFPEIRVSGYDPDPDTGESFSLHPRQPVVYQRAEDVERNLWWVNAQRPLAERIISDEARGADSARWRDYVFSRFVEVIQAYETRERWDGTTDLAEFMWRLVGEVHDSATSELSDILFTAEESPAEAEIDDDQETAADDAATTPA